MGYRGEDLDLRTPQTWSAGAELGAAPDPQGTFNGQRSLFRGNAIWVDDTVLAVANHAFDVALAHRSAEVRLEHLIYALTRLEASSDVLEARGVRVAALRRDAAITIASEIPTSLTSGKQQPRRSDELAEVLRLAAQSGSRRGSPGTAEDVLNILLDLRTDHPAGVLLLRHVGRNREAQDYPLVTQRFATEPPRPRSINEPYRYDMPAVAVSTDYTPRLDAIEETLRSLSGSVTNETGLLNELLADVSKSLAGQREDTARLQTGILENLRSGETRLDQRLAELGQRWSGLTDKLAHVEQLITSLPKGSSAAVDLEPVALKLGTIEEALLTRPEAPWQPLEQQVSGVSSAVGYLDTTLQNLAATVANALAGTDNRVASALAAFPAERTETANAVIAPITEKLGELKLTLEGALNADRGDFDQLTERVAALEDVLSKTISATVSAREAYVKDLTALHDALIKLNANQHTLAGSIDHWRLDATGDLSIIANRLDKLDAENERPVELMKSLMTTSDNMNRLIIERYHRRNRFWYWLFGTDDWITASWPSQVASVEHEMRNLRERSTET